MKITMNSHDRIMCTMSHQEPDHVPLYLLLMHYDVTKDKDSKFTFGNQIKSDIRREFSIKNCIKRVEETTNLGLDDTLLIEPPLGMAEEYFVEGVKDIKLKIDKYHSESKEFLKKTYITPDGKLNQVTQKTEDWPHGDNIPLFSDHAVPRTKEFLIKTSDDIKKLKYLIGEPKKEEYLKFKESADLLRKEAKRLGVVLEGGWLAIGECLVWLLGIQNMILNTFDRSYFIEELIDLFCKWELKRAEMLINEGIEVLVQSAWYDATDFWTPDAYNKIIKPRNLKLIEIAKQAGIKYKYIISKSVEELSDHFLEMGIDNIMGVDPIQGNVNLKNIKNKIGAKICLWGGINSAITLGRGSKDDIEKAVEEAIKTLSPNGGFVLYPVDNIIAEANPWGNIEIMIKKWKEISSYPISF